mmetsp:Transcript_23742/g.53584  ORF Transcript_23742/g.53584 Transcript_23742/m.53584 type:complete len:90 (-) Transcript_23742:195-464(-)
MAPWGTFGVWSISLLQGSLTTVKPMNATASHKLFNGRTWSAKRIHARERTHQRGDTSREQETKKKEEVAISSEIKRDLYGLDSKPYLAA